MESQITQYDLEYIRDIAHEKDAHCLEYIIECSNDTTCKHYGLTFSTYVNRQRHYSLLYMPCSKFINKGQYATAHSGNYIKIPHIYNDDDLIERSKKHFKKLDYLYLDSKFKHVTNDDFSSIDWQHKYMSYPGFRWYVIKDSCILGYDQHYMLCVLDTNYVIKVKCNASAECTLDKLRELLDDYIEDDISWAEECRVVYTKIRDLL